MSERVLVTGVGVLSALGDRLELQHAALCAGAHGVRRVEGVSTEGLGEVHAAELPSFEPAAYLGNGNLRPLDRTSRLATVATKLALEDAGLSGEPALREQAGLALGTMFGSVRTIAEFDRRALTAGPSYVSPLDFANSVINAAAGQAAIWHGLRGINATLAGGTTAGAQAIGYAADQLGNGACSVLLAGGAEEVCFESLLGYQRWRPTSASPRPFSADRDGAALGEGAALLVLETAAAAQARGARARAEVLGHGLAFDPVGGATEEGLVEALAAAIGLALADSGLRPSEVDLVSVSASGDPVLDRAEGRALGEALGGRAAEVAVLAVKGALGDCLGAGAAMQAAAAVAALETGEIPGLFWLIDPEPGLALRPARETTRRPLRHALVTTLGADGQAGALALAVSEERR